MTKKSKDLLVDAVVVIHAHEKNYWERLCNTHRVFLSATVLENELFYFSSDKGKKSLPVQTWLKEGKIIRVEADHSDLDLLVKKLSDDFMAGIHNGELEALALLLSKNHQNLHFSTADRAAVKALGLLNLRTRGISVETIVEGLQGISLKQLQLEPQYSHKWFEKALSEGFAEQHLWLKSAKQP